MARMNADPAGQRQEHDQQPDEGLELTEQPVGADEGADGSIEVAVADHELPQQSPESLRIAHEVRDYGPAYMTHVLAAEWLRSKGLD